MKLFRSILALACGVASTALISAQSVDRFEVPESLDLSTALEFALENNFEILKAKQRIEEQNGLIIEVRARALPDVSLRGQYIELDDGLSEVTEFSPAVNTQWSLALNARQTLYAGGGVRAALEAQDLIEQAALLELESVINDALLSVREGFFGALLARSRIQVQEENIELLEEQLLNAEKRFEVGTISSFEVLRSKVDLANARAPLIRARNDYRLSIEELRQLLGFFSTEATSLGKAPEFVGELLYTPSNYDLATSIQSALSKRPELQRLKAVFEARKQGVTIAKSEGRPEVNLIGSYQINKSRSSNRFNDGLDGWTAGLEVNVPVFDGRRSKGQVIQAKAREAQSDLEYKQATLSVEVEVRRALSDLQEAAELADASIQVVGQAEEALEQATARYNAGSATQLDVMQTRVALTQSRLNKTEAFYRYNVAQARVRKAVGTAE